jgi:hypothetical protein
MSKAATAPDHCIPDLRSLDHGEALDLLIGHGLTVEADYDEAVRTVRRWEGMKVRVLLKDRVSEQRLACFGGRLNEATIGDVPIWFYLRDGKEATGFFMLDGDAESIDACSISATSVWIYGERIVWSIEVH